MLNKYNTMMNRLTYTDTATKIRDVNMFFNHRIKWVSDLELRGQNDYFATPKETMQAGAGDCEDFAIAKFKSLKKLGLKNIRMAYCQVNGSNQKHMVCIANGFVLDNTTDLLLPIAMRKDLTIIHSFNNQWLFINNHIFNAKKTLKQWAGVIKRMDDETANA